MLPDGALEVSAGEERLWLLPQLAAYWPRTETLLVADAHLGKAAAFRSAGVPVPAGTTADNLDRLTHLVEILRARRIAFLGDLVHNRAAREAADGGFVRWRTRHASLDMLLVLGNHERSAGAFADAWGLEVVTEPCVRAGLALCHKPQSAAGAYAIAGHVHPAARLYGRGRENLRLPCFYFTPDFAILPAFGAFTGMAEVTATAADRVYVAADSCVLRVSE